MKKHISKLINKLFEINVKIKGGMKFELQGDNEKHFAVCTLFLFWFPLISLLLSMFDVNAYTANKTGKEAMLMAFMATLFLMLSFLIEYILFKYILIGLSKIYFHFCKEEIKVKKDIFNLIDTFLFKLTYNNSKKDIPYSKFKCKMINGDIKNLYFIFEPDSRPKKILTKPFCCKMGSELKIIETTNSSHNQYSVLDIVSIQPITHNWHVIGLYS